MRLFSALLIGLIFGIGIAISGMMNPAKVLNFFDITGNWDPSLAFVMGGAILIAIPGYHLVLARKAPLFETKFQLPDTKLIDAKLIAGSTLFGIGWGIAGFCPGGALPALGTLHPKALVFVAALIIGLLIAKGMKALTARYLARSA
ncbi:DUF6691 family protein [Brucella gallinifaecis]|uniref:YeeE/YedE family protein n=1 Tax=Brucella gallinifaecis TaxID=215590 RepID=A0A502BJ71_9HYPH|nr:DUF6691 family protein [Brucella gallinifaecis]TPF74190.1 YeeE/YedE family protein [Brucella gallinifaecis]